MCATQSRFLSCENCNPIRTQLNHHLVWLVAEDLCGSVQASCWRAWMPSAAAVFSLSVALKTPRLTTYKELCSKVLAEMKIWAPPTNSGRFQSRDHWKMETCAGWILVFFRIFKQILSIFMFLFSMMSSVVAWSVYIFSSAFRCSSELILDRAAVEDSRPTGMLKQHTFQSLRFGLLVHSLNSGIQKLAKKVWAEYAFEMKTIFSKVAGSC